MSGVKGRSGRRPTHPVNRFWPKVDKTDGCWLWSASRNNNGYAVFHDGKRFTYGHRFVYELLVGEIPEGLELDHLCNVRHCVNPAHLEPVTQAENLRRRSARQTHCKHGHLRVGNTNSGGQCKTCATLRRQAKQVAA